MAFLIPLMQPAATALATYFGVTTTAATVTTTVTASVAPALSAAATKAAQIGVTYLGGTVLQWSCEEAMRSNAEFCKNPLDSASCFAMKGSELTSCYGSWIAKGAIVYDVLDWIRQGKK